MTILNDYRTCEFVLENREEQKKIGAIVHKRHIEEYAKSLVARSGGKYVRVTCFVLKYGRIAGLKPYKAFRYSALYGTERGYETQPGKFTFGPRYEQRESEDTVTNLHVGTHTPIPAPALID